MNEQNRIGLLTIHDTVNFGSLLQTCCTCWALKQLKANFWLIDYQNDTIRGREYEPSLSETHSPKAAMRWLIYGRIIRRKHKEFLKALQSAARITKPYFHKTISDANKEFDSFIAGSDLVWNERVTGRDLTYLFDFADDSKGLYAFSSSIGDFWGGDYCVSVKQNLQRFRKITVREKEAACWVREVASVPATETCDPTMLFDPEFWRNYTIPQYTSKKYVLVYMVSNSEMVRQAQEYARTHGCSVWVVNYERSLSGTKSVKPRSPEEWVSLIRYADTVFTASYHGLLFCLYLHKNLFFYNNRGSKSRMNNIVEEFGISHREYSEDNVLRDIPVDYDVVDSVLAKKRAVGWSKLAEIINDALVG